MLQNIPTHVIAGPLGAGKTSLIRHLMTQRPQGERWAVLVNEFGQVGLDAALLSRDEDGIAIGEVAGGCLCCVNGMPFQVGLGRLLRQARPDRLFIEPSGLGHPLQLLRQLGAAPWLGVLSVQPLVVVLDAKAMSRGDPLPEAQSQALAAAGLVVVNKSEAVDESSRLLIKQQLGEIPALWTEQGRIGLARLPILPTGRLEVSEEPAWPVDSVAAPAAALWTDPRMPICLAEAGEGGWSIGWRWHPSRQFDPQLLQAVLQALPWKRAKGVIHSPTGWLSFNGLDGSLPPVAPSDWRRDSRIELIFDQPQVRQTLHDAVQRCVID